MAPATSLDAVVVGAGPNGLVAAITLARAGLEVRVYEAAATIGGGARTEELTLPGFRHDVCSAVHPLGAGSPVFRSLPLADHGLAWVQPPLPVANPLGSGGAAVLHRSLDETATSLGNDGDWYRRLVEPLASRWEDLASDILRPALGGWPRHPVTLARFGTRALQPAAVLARRARGVAGRTLVSGLAAHAQAPLGSPATGAIAMVFAAAGHAVGWPFPAGGSQAIADALASYLRSLGGEIVTGHLVESLDVLPRAAAYLLDVAPEHAVAIAGPRLSPLLARRLMRCRHGPGAFKVDYALDGPVPWSAEACHHAGTVHLGGSDAEIAASLRAATRGQVPDPPFVIAAQQSRFDPSRAPEGRHTLWAYGHVPTGWRGDLTEAIDRQIERFAPGFRDRILARAAMGPAQLEARNRNDIGGDIAGGAFRGLQTVFRPVVAADPYATSDRSVYLCSAATPPGPGVHGLCGHYAARSALRRVFGRRVAPL